jgi:hypothetical protein
VRRVNDQLREGKTRAISVLRRSERRRLEKSKRYRQRQRQGKRERKRERKLLGKFNQYDRLTFNRVSSGMNRKAKSLRLFKLECLLVTKRDYTCAYSNQTCDLPLGLTIRRHIPLGVTIRRHPPLGLTIKPHLLLGLTIRRHLPLGLTIKSHLLLVLTIRRHLPLGLAVRRHPLVSQSDVPYSWVSESDITYH